MSQTIDVPLELKQNMRKFRFGRHKGTAAFIARVNKKELIIEEDEIIYDVDIEELAEELPESSPRFVILHYEIVHDDGRKSFPLVLINWAPSGSEVGMMTLHASAFILFQELADANKTLEVRDGAEGLTKEIIDKICA